MVNTNKPNGSPKAIKVQPKNSIKVMAVCLLVVLVADFIKLFISIHCKKKYEMIIKIHYSFKYREVLL